MVCEKHYIDTEGILVRVDTVEDITLATDTKLNVRKPDGTEVTWVATKGDSTHLEYVSVAGDFNQAGFYRLQAEFTLDGWAGRCSTAEFAMYPKFG